jgi:hypothetical protein
MAHLAAAAASWQTLLMVLVVFGFAPGFVLRLLVRIYPKSDPRRTELIAELHALGWIERPLFVVEQMETVLSEGVPHRFKTLQERWRARSRQIDAAAGDIQRGTVPRHAGDPWWTWARQWDRLGEHAQAEHVLREGIEAGHPCLWRDLAWGRANAGDQAGVEHFVQLAAGAGYQISPEELVRIQKYLREQVRAIPSV